MLAEVNVVDPPAPELRVTVEAPEESVKAPKVSLATAAELPLNTSSPPLSVTASASPIRLATFVAVLSNVSLPPGLRVNAVVVDVPAPLSLYSPALIVVAPV